MSRAPDTRPRTTSAEPPSAYRHENEDGSVVTEYGLIAILGATVTGLAIKWASGGAIFALFGAIFDKVKALVGA